MKDKSDDGIKARILTESVSLFAEKGFHGTSMRDLSKRAACSLPMLYYYYSSKEALFYELAYTAFVQLIEKLNAEIPRNLPFETLYLLAIQQRMALSPYDKAIYKLALKVWLGFDGDSKVRHDLMAWEEDRLERTLKILTHHFKDTTLMEDRARLMVRVLEHMIERIILFDEVLSEELIRAELGLIIATIQPNGGKENGTR